MDHQEKLKKVQSQIVNFYEQRVPFRVFHGSTNSTRIIEFERDKIVDVSDFKEILGIDSEKRLARVEPNVPMDKLVDETLKQGLIPKIVMEFPGITVGGGIAGVGGESSSFKYGAFSEICPELEVITADGVIHRASRELDSDLYHNFAGSFGTLGVLTAAAVELIAAKPYVQLTYHIVRSQKEAVEKIMELSRQADVDYIDGILYAKDYGVIMSGKLSEDKAGSLKRFTGARDNWFYLHAKKNVTRTETLPIRDYLFRYDRGAFWMGRYAFKLFHVPFSRLTRFLLNPMFHTREMYEALQASGASQQFIVQDLGLPLENSVAFLDFIDKNFSVYPLWLCPLRPSDSSPFQLNNMPTPMAINVGVWSDRRPDYQKFIAENRQLEKELIQLKGKKWLYAQAFYEEDEFWALYSRSDYEAIRQKYHADYLPDIYSKVHVTKEWPVTYNQGVLKMLMKQAKLRMK